MNLSWYKNIKIILKLENLYHMDHVSAFKYLHQEIDITTDSSQHSNHINNSQLNIIPISFKKYRIESIMNSLKDHFKSIWEQEKKDLGLKRNLTLTLFKMPNLATVQPDLG